MDFNLKTENLILLIVLLISVIQYSFVVDGVMRDLEKQSRFCRNYPNGLIPPYRFHRETRRCYQVGDRGPCHEHMKFTLEDDDFGFCDCDLSARCGRPLVYWPGRDRCYYVYDQGPCRDGKIVMFGFDLQPVCKKNICMDQEEKQPSVGSKYWFNLNSTCYRTFTQGYCPENEVLFNMKLHYRATCQRNPDCGERNAVQVAKCLPGQRLDTLGHCRRKFIPLRNTTKPLGIHVTQKPANIHCLFCEDKKPLKYKI